MKPACSVPFTVTRFVVSTVGEEPRQFTSEAEAERAALAAAERTGGATLYKVIGEPVTDLWRKPERIAAFSRVGR